MEDRIIEDETIVCACVLTSFTVMIRCKRHWDWIRIAKNVYWENNIKQWQQWFLTNMNRFVDREEAFKIAKNAGQLKAINQIDWEPIDYTNETLLYSEYIW